MIPRFLLSVSLYLLLFLGLPGKELFFQLGGLAFFVLSTAWAAVATGIAKIEISAFESSLLCTGLLSLIVSFLLANEFSIQYSLLFIFIIAAIFILVRSLSLLEIVSAAGQAYVAILITIWATSFSELAKTLTMNAADRWMLRFAPFGLHPNLFGFISGGGCAVLLLNATLAKGIKRLLYLAASISCVPLILAASARASLLALLVASVGLAALNLRRYNRKYTGFIVSLVVLVGLLKWETIYQYLNDVLELSSETRGINSGGSGRDVAWEIGVSRIFADESQFLFGVGLRAATESWLGFTTESSYINILLESGCVVGLFLITTILRITYVLVSLLIESNTKDLYNMNALCIFMLFVPIESIFNRYMIGIGNPLSLLFMIVCAKISISTRNEVCHWSNNALTEATEIGQTPLK